MLEYVLKEFLDGDIECFFDILDYIIVIGKKLYIMVYFLIKMFM